LCCSFRVTPIPQSPLPPFFPTPSPENTAERDLVVGLAPDDLLLVLDQLCFSHKIVSMSIKPLSLSVTANLFFLLSRSLIGSFSDQTLFAIRRYLLTSEVDKFGFCSRFHCLEWVFFLPYLLLDYGCDGWFN